MRAAIINLFCDVPQTFHGPFGLITQPSEREIYLAQIIPMEQLLQFPNVKKYINRKRYEGVNDIDNIRLGEYFIHV